MISMDRIRISWRAQARFLLCVVMLWGISFLHPRDAAAQTVTLNATSQSISARRPHAVGVYVPSGNKTFYCWAGSDGSDYMKIKLRTFFNGSEIYGNTKTLSGTGNQDYHDYPTMIQADDGRLLVFYADHNWDLRMYRANVASSIWDGWTSSVATYDNAGYPMPVKSANGDIYVFYRKSFYPHIGDVNVSSHKIFRYIKSTDNGVTWQSPKTIIDFNQSDDLNNIYAAQVVHAQAAGNYPERFVFSWTRAGFNPNPDPQDPGSYNARHDDLFFAYMRISDGKMFSASHQNLGSQVDDSDFTKTMVVDTPTPVADQWAIGHFMLADSNSSDGYPLIVYPRYWQSGNVNIFAARWTGSSWNTGIGMNLPANSGVGDLEQTGPNHYLAFIRDGNDGEKIVKRATYDGGQTWSNAGDITGIEHFIKSINLIDGAPSNSRIFAHTHNDVPFYQADYTTGYKNYIVAD